MLSFFQVKKWVKMLSGNSIDHVNQNIGKYFIVSDIKGYYNNLIEKVTKNQTILNNEELPLVYTEKQEPILFPIAIFQYGLGSYDLYLASHEEIYKKKFFQCVDWAIAHIDEKGRWNNFFFYKPETPFSAMAQGEGASLLIRAYIETGDQKYLDTAKMAIDFMLLPLEKGGTTKYEDCNAYLMEYSFKGMVLNGAIFAWWGLYDYVLATQDSNIYKKKLDILLDSILLILPKFRCKYWSMYSLDGLIASPFYHNLHIAQMEAMYKITKNPIFNEYASTWKKQQKNWICATLAFIKKSCQKLLE